MPGFSAPARLTFASPGGGSPTPRVLVKVNRSIRRTSRALADTQHAVWEHLSYPDTVAAAAAAAMAATQLNSSDNPVSLASRDHYQGGRQLMGSVALRGADAFSSSLSHSAAPRADRN